MKNHKRVSVPRLLTPVALAITLAACSSTPSTSDVDITSAPTQSAQRYLMQADSTQGSIQNDWLILALKAAIQAGDTQQAELIVNRLSKQQLSDAQQAEWQLARAQLLVTQERYPQALKQLNFQPSWQLDDQQWLEYHQLRAELLTRQGKYFDASRELTLASPYLIPSQQPMLSEQIWSNLTKYKTDDITELAAAPNEAVLDGWLQLAVYAKTMTSDIPQLKNTLEKWLAENPNHPAAQYTPQSLTNILALDIIKPVNSALLLPLSGKYAKQAQLIRDGFMMKMMNDPNRDPNASLTVIDTNTNSAEQIKQTLVQKNIDFIVGPLTKENVEDLQREQSSLPAPIPTLALNIPDQLEDGPGVCYLALSPEQEVAQAAKHLHELGYQFPLLLAPKGRLGERVTEAFEKEWRKYSPNKVAVSLFGDKRQLQRNINTVFGLQDSQQRITQMQSLMRRSLESQPRSRRDIDAVYIVAKSSELTLIKPFIEVAINPDTAPPKLFANSSSNNGRKQYEDLTGVAYSDIPLLISPDPQTAEQMAELWPRESNVEKRLKAMGMDAYTLMEELPQMKVVSGYTVDGQTGILSIDSQCVVQREISWGEYGKATPVTTTGSDDIATDELPTAEPDETAEELEPSL
ncbi:penicillin-binding protein activator [Vibrio sp. V39_P1S14PM300]|uniref:penicillin-binding protein activator n=1 Tax=Vibrio sp. V39_P1S14PM300 TaxID=1938690 RepID=UPI001372923C|nr:penicillin-binding protein activator [Vibrio sp. V39_P1S14PM300]NAX23212.1 YraN family protein [Vibrio sp. V39_P1S14PM300]